MSGTSLDGLDMVYVRFTHERGRWHFEILDSKTLDYSKTEERWDQKLESAYQLPIDQLGPLNEAYARYLGDQVRTFKGDRQVDLLGSHGHTIMHQPGQGLTYQLGSHEAIATNSGIVTVGDFRTADVQLGGQGAPLVPIGDRLLFGDFHYCLNLGGFSNVSFESGLDRIAFDISPSNMLLNRIASMIDWSFDHDGELASAGTIDQSLLERWNELDYYSRSFPKSLGREWFDKNFNAELSKTDLSVEDLLATATEHIAFQIGRILRMESPCLLTGGGAFNKFLVDRIRHYSNAQIVLPERTIIEFKEALIFAFLAVLRVRDEINVLASVTGAEHDHCTGVIYQA